MSPSLSRSARLMDDAAKPATGLMDDVKTQVRRLMVAGAIPAAEATSRTLGRACRTPKAASVRPMRTSSNPRVPYRDASAWRSPRLPWCSPS